ARIEAVAGVPLQITFDRQESGDCTSRVVFPDLGVTRALQAFEQTVVELTPDRSGEFGFSCAMNMVHATLTVTPADGAPPATATVTTTRSVAAAPDPALEEAREAEARRAEVRGLTRRTAASAVLTAPVLFAVMARDVFNAGW